MNRREFLKALAGIPLVGVAGKLALQKPDDMPDTIWDMPDTIWCYPVVEAKPKKKATTKYNDGKIRLITPDDRFYIVKEFTATYNRPNEFLCFDIPVPEYPYRNSGTIDFRVLTVEDIEFNATIANDVPCYSIRGDVVELDFAGYRVIGLT